MLWHLLSPPFTEMALQPMAGSTPKIKLLPPVLGKWPQVAAWVRGGRDGGSSQERRRSWKAAEQTD